MLFCSSLQGVRLQTIKRLYLENDLTQFGRLVYELRFDYSEQYLDRASQQLLFYPSIYEFLLKSP